jgi:hypothetical protein
MLAVRRFARGGWIARPEFDLSLIFVKPAKRGYARYNGMFYSIVDAWFLRRTLNGIEQ